MIFRAVFFKILPVIALFLIGDLIIFFVLKNGMDTYYGMDKKAEILLVGHSHTVLGIDGDRLQEQLELPVAKYATAGANVLDRYWMIQQYVETHPSVKVVIYDVDPRLFDTEGLSSASYSLFLPYLDNPAMSKYLKQEATWQEYYTGRFIHTSRFRDQTINIALRGLLGRIENKKTGVLRVDDYANYLEGERARKIRVNPESVEYFKKSIDYLSDKGINLILVFIPVAWQLNSIDESTQKKVINIFENIGKSHNNVLFLDYNQDYQHDLKLFYDLRHLNADGNALVTEMLAGDIKLFLENEDSATGAN